MHSLNLLFSALSLIDRCTYIHEYITVFSSPHTIAEVSSSPEVSPTSVGGVRDSYDGTVAGNAFPFSPGKCDSMTIVNTAEGVGGVDHGSGSLGHDIRPVATT